MNNVNGRVRNSTGACVVHCVRDLAECPINLRVLTLIRATDVDMDDVTSFEVLTSTRRSVLEDLRENFALISAFAGLTAILGSTVFLYGYLTVFDWRLIWVI